MNVDVTRILSDALVAVITLVIPAIGAAAVAWFTAHRGDKRVQLAQRLITAAVQAVEQLYGGLSGDDKQKADAKLLAAMSRARDLLAQFGLRFTDDQLRTLIENAVLEMKKDFPLVLPGVLSSLDPPPAQLPATTP